MSDVNLKKPTPRGVVSTVYGNGFKPGKNTNTVDVDGIDTLRPHGAEPKRQGQPVRQLILSTVSAMYGNDPNAGQAGITVDSRLGIRPEHRRER